MSEKFLMIFWMIIFLLFFGTASHSFCQSNEYFFSNFSSGIGARALGMGKAYLAVSDDSSAPSWNPAGLASLSRAEFSISFSYNNLKTNIHDYSYSSPQTGYTINYRVSEINSRSIGKYFDFLSFAFPFNIRGKNIVAQISYQRKIPFSMTDEYDYKLEYQSRYQFDYDYRYKAEGSGGFDIISISAASEIVSGLRLGVSINRWFNGYSLPIEEVYLYSLANYYGLTEDWVDRATDSLEFEISGYNISVGLLYKIFDRVDLGLVYKSPFQGDIDYSNKADYWDGYTESHQSSTYSSEGMIVFPSSFGAGIAFRASDDLLVSFGYTKTFWSKGKIKDYARVNSDGGIPSSEDFLYPTMKIPDIYEQLNTQQYSLGGEYIIKKELITVPLRAGIFYDFQYSLDIENNQKKYWGISIGSGVRWKNLSLDLAMVNYFGKYKYAHDLDQIYSGETRNITSYFLIFHSSLSYKF
jgi:long-subunit fatty acid transport protein